MNDKRPAHPWPVNSAPPSSSTTAAPVPASAPTSHPMTAARPDSTYSQNPLPPILPAKRSYEDDAWLPNQAASNPPQPSQPLHVQHAQQQAPAASHQAHIRMPNESFEDVKMQQYAQTRRQLPPTSNPQHIGAASPQQPMGSAAPSGATAGATAAAAAAAAAAVTGPPHAAAAVAAAAAAAAAAAPPAASGSAPVSSTSPMDSFILAAEMGARAQSAVDSESGEGVFETYELGKSIVASSKLYANQRRSNRQLPGGSDSTTAACYMIGGTPDSVLSPLISRVNPCDPREERCKAVERVLKDKTRGAICALNGENPREARADNLAAVRICEVVADVLVAYSSRRLVESRKELYLTVTKQEGMIKELKEELAKERRRREEIETEQWGPNADGRGMMTSEVQAFERDKLVRRGVLTSSGHRSIDSDRGSMSETPTADKGDAQ